MLEADEGRIPSPVTELSEFQAWCKRTGAPRSLATSSDPSPLMIIQSHYDDAALSISGTLAQQSWKSLLVTTHGGSSIAEQRALEDARLATLIRAVCLGWDIPETTGAISRDHVNQLQSELSRDRYTLLAPAAVGRNPDHRASMRLAHDLGCRVFWEDVAFWGIYGLSTDDRVEFSMLKAEWLENFVLVVNPIDSAIHVKRWILQNYPSQSSDVWRPMRFAWNVAREAGMECQFSERFFVHKDAVFSFAKLMGKSLGIVQEVPYGIATVASVPLVRNPLATAGAGGGLD